MTHQEFEQRVGMEVNEKYYHAVIEKIYYASDLEKDSFCRGWLRDHKGITEDLLRNIALDTLPLVRELKEREAELYSEREIQIKVVNQKKQLKEYIRSLEIELDTIRGQQEENARLIYRLYKVAQETKNIDLRDEVVKVWGWHDYLLYKLRNDDAIWEDEKKEMINLLD